MNENRLPSIGEIREALLTLQDTCRYITENYNDCCECPLFSEEFNECGLSAFDYETDLHPEHDYSGYLIP